ncbi:hypothetical protein [Streptomyces sp. DH41]|uniref:hypothetical protein n=1 Tax=Streptomyces sp. DH41 TaxID=3040125 RepID=UPI00244271EB|nr:hypothetical protein [Streptomyces sp. DH41]MDG9724257.1 hypothetical protein [Streptomyces sp. DH41]
MKTCAPRPVPVHGSGPHPHFDDAIWDFTGVIGMPRYLARYARILSFTEILNPQWRDLAKEFIFARLAPDHPAVRELAHAFRIPVQIATVHGRLTMLTGWLNWLTEQGVDNLTEVTQQHCAAYLELRKKVRDKHGVVIRDSSPGYRMHLVAVIQELGGLQGLPRLADPPSQDLDVVQKSVGHLGPHPDSLLVNLVSATIRIRPRVAFFAVSRIELPTRLAMTYTRAASSRTRPNLE